jgi:hypothetical protein
MAGSGRFEIKSDAFSMRVYQSGAPAGADVLHLAPGKHGRCASCNFIEVLQLNSEGEYGALEKPRPTPAPQQPRSREAVTARRAGGIFEQYLPHNYVN